MRAGADAWLALAKDRVNGRGFSLAPGDGGSAVLDHIFLAPAGAAGQETLRVAAPADWRSLCGHAYDWIEIVDG